MNHIVENNEIIVYLISFERTSDNDYTIWIDFRQKTDRFLYLETVGRNVKSSSEEDFSSGSLLEIRGCRLFRRPRRDSYYSLNIELLKQGHFYEDDVRRSTFDGIYTLYDVAQGPSYTILQTHSGLAPNPQLFDSVYSSVPNGILVNTAPNHNYVSEIKKVGQGNWNELQEDGNAIIVYDIGTGFLLPDTVKRSIFCNQSNSIGRNRKALLVISHWDIDHIQCLDVMSEQEIKDCFYAVVCPTYWKSHTAENLINKLKKVFSGNELIAVENPPKTGRGRNRMHCIASNNLCSLYIGEKQSSTNKRGICMLIYTFDKSVCYSGDCNLLQLQDMINQSPINLTNHQYHVLIAPHHGGYMDKSYTPFPNMLVVVSVDGNKNTYGHPNHTMMSYYDLISNNRTYRTDYNGNIRFDICP